MPTVFRADKQYKVNAVMDALVAIPLDPATLSVSSAPDGSSITIRYTNISDETAINTVLDNHNASDESMNEAVTNNRTLLIDNARARFKTELESETPDWATLYTDVSTALGTRPAVLSRMQNMSELIGVALGIADLSLVSAAQRNAIRLLATVLVLVLYR